MLLTMSLSEKEKNRLNTAASFEEKAREIEGHIEKVRDIMHSETKMQSN